MNYKLKILKKNYNKLFIIGVTVHLEKMINNFYHFHKNKFKYSLIY